MLTCYHDEQMILRNYRLYIVSAYQEITSLLVHDYQMDLIVA